MKTEDEVRRIETNIRSYLEDGLFRKGDYQYLVDFYLNTAKRSHAQTSLRRAKEFVNQIEVLIK